MALRISSARRAPWRRRSDWAPTSSWRLTSARNIRRIATARWAARSKKYFDQHKQEVPWGSNAHVGTDAFVRPVDQGRTNASVPTRSEQTQALFGIVQGGMDRGPSREYD